MKILILSDLYPPIIGGQERHAQSLSRELSKRGHEVTVCTIGHQGLPEYEEEGGVKIYRVQGFFQKIPLLFKDPTRRLHPPIRDWLVTNHLRHILEEGRPDIIHTHGRILYSALALRKRFDIPIVVTLHSYALLCPKTNLMRGNTICDKPFTRDCIACSKDSYGLPKSLFAYYGTRVGKGRLRLVDKFIAVSSFVKEVHAKHLGLSDKDIVMIHNFCDTDADGQGEKVENLPEDFVLFVGALIPGKGVNVLIKAFQSLHTKTKLVLIGGTYPDYHYQSTKNIRVIENAPHHAVMEAMLKCRFAVFPSIWPEPFALVTIEAMSQRKAVIASNIGGLKEAVVDGETGILVSPNNSNKLSDAIFYLLEKPEVASRMGESGYRVFMGNYTPDAIIPKIIEVYEGLLYPAKARRNRSD